MTGRHSCPSCPETFPTKAGLYSHEIVSHPHPPPVPPEHKPMAKQKSKGTKKGAEPKPTENSITVEAGGRSATVKGTSIKDAAGKLGAAVEKVLPVAHRPYGSGGIQWASRSDVGTIYGEIYQARWSEESWEKFNDEKDPTKRVRQIARHMKLAPGTDGLSKETLKSAFAQDLETIFRVCNGIDLKGSRGPTIEEVANRNGDGKKGGE